MPKKWRPVRAKHAFYEQRGVSAEILGEKELREAEPNLREGLAGALLAPADSVVYAPCAAIFSHRGIQGEWRC